MNWKMRMSMCECLLLQMESCRLEVDCQEMKRLIQIDQLRGLESKLPSQKRVQLLQILRALKLSLIFPLFQIGVVQRKN
jgi:hypothetical protein